MDLEEFDDPVTVPEKGFRVNLSFAQALELVDDVWFGTATRSARWMDLLGDYAGTEPFVIDGEALIQIVLDDPLLAIGRQSDSRFQMLHAYYLLETILDDFKQRSANFEIVFWHESRHLSVQTGDPWPVVASRALARSMLFAHLLKMDFKVHTFNDLADSEWKKYYYNRKPMFIMTNDGGLDDEDMSDLKAAMIFLQRAFFLNILSSGVPVALLRGAEYRNSKIFSFIYESRSGLVLEGYDMIAPVIILAKKRLDTSLRQGFGEAEKRLRVSGRLTLNDVNSRITVFRDLAVASYTGQGVSPEIVYLFVVHSLLTPSLSVRERAQFVQSLPFGIENEILERFFPRLFFRAANLLALDNYPLEVDGTIFAMLITYIISRRGQLLTAIGPILHAEAEELWSALAGPPVDFDAFASRYSASAAHIVSNRAKHSNREPYQLLPFTNPVFDQALSLVHVQTTGDESPGSLPSNSDENVRFSDMQHWHNRKTILPVYLGGNAPPMPVDVKARQRQLRSDQRFMATLQGLAATLTGASGGVLRQIVITPVTLVPASQHGRDKISYGRGKKVKTPSKAELMKREIEKGKNAAHKSSSLVWWKQQLSKMKGMSLADRAEQLKSLARNPRTEVPEIMLEIQLYSLNLECQTWIEDPQKVAAHKKDKYTVSIMRTVKAICDRKFIIPSARKVLTAILTALGFYDHFSALLPLENSAEDQPLSFSFVKLVRSKTKELYHPFMVVDEHPIVWQLRLFGDYMDRSMDSTPDTRVAFEPDAWQRRVLDGIDKNKSLLVVAPTSAGKTFISYYAMERVLKESNDGILVYIAPTKALVTQIAAEVYARFNKTLNGKSCWAIHTRDYRIHEPMDCQILITVPEILGTMLLSPACARVWTPRIRWIILDEIHSIGQEDGGAVWEQIILLAPCPIIGLSATIGSPEIFSNWLASVQKVHNFEYEFIEHRHRYSHLRKFFYRIDGTGASNFTGLDKHKATDRARFLHPISLLSFGARILPPDLSLEASDTLTLSNAFLSVRHKIDYELDPLKPMSFFASSSAFLRQQDILRYEECLKSTLMELIRASDPRDISTPIGQVVQSLEDSEIRRLGSTSQRKVTGSDFKEDLLVLLADLHAKDQLPAILFNFNRTECEIMAQHLLTQIEDAEKKWRHGSPEWDSKMKQWDAWKAQSKLRERNALRMQRKGTVEVEEDITSPISWESSFKPEDPSPQFSFANPRASYSNSKLEKDIENMRWTTIPGWAFDALKRGIAVHHAGMHKHYRSLVESLFRKGFVRVMIATGTLALGINAPAKTSVFCGDSPFLTALMYRQCAGRAGRRGFDLRGNIVFYGLPLDRVQRLILSKLPSLGGNFPLTSTLTLRMFSLLDGSSNAETAVRATQSILSLPQITLNSQIGRDQLLHHLRFSIEYLIRSRLLDRTGKPINHFTLAAHLYYTEPSNLALITLIESGVLRTICNQSDQKSAKKDFMILMCNLFGRRNFSKVFGRKKNIDMLTKKYPSMIILPPLPKAASKVLVAHDREILRIFAGYALAFVTQHDAKIGPDDTLPVSKLRYCGSASSRHLEASSFVTHLRENAVPALVRSAFVANSGYDDSFKTVSELTRTSRSGLHLNGHAIPSMSHFVVDGNDDLEHRLNAHILDFYTHGQVSTLAKANGIRRGDVWYILQDFHLTLSTVKSALERFMTEASKDTNQEDIANYGYDPAESADAIDDNDEGEEEGPGRSSTANIARPKGIDPSDWKVYEIVSAVCDEFWVKFKAMWA